MLLQLHAKTQNNSTREYLIRLEKPYLGPILSAFGPKTLEQYFFLKKIQLHHRIFLQPVQKKAQANRQTGKGYFIGLSFPRWDHLFNTHAKFSGKLTFLKP